MSRTCVALVTIVALALGVPAEAQPVPWPFKTKVRATPTATAVPPTVTAARTVTRTPTPTATSGALPDLVVDVRDIQLQVNTTAADGDVAEGCAEATTGVDLLRFSALSENIGTADLVLGDPQCPLPCSDHPLAVCGNPDYICSPAAGHNHPHYTNYARYELLDRNGESVVVGHKQGYCLRDTSCASPVYTCAYQGISAGCYDTYDYTLGCQYIDVTGIPDGDYVLRVTIDPLQKIPELSDANNVTTKPVTIARPGRATATPSRTVTPARTPTPVATMTSPTTASVTPTLTAAVPTVSAPVATPTPRDPNDAVAAACRRVVLQAGRALVDRALAGIDACTDAVAACEPERRRTSACVARAVAACDAGVARVDDAQADFVSRVVARCEDVGGGRLGGIGACDGTTNDVAGTARCIAGRTVCRSGSLVESEDPRAGARLGRAGARPSELCVDDLGGAGVDGPDRPDARPLASCARTVRRAARLFARHRLATLQSCLATHLACAKADVPAACEARARDVCAARVARLGADEDRLSERIERGCGDLDFATLRSVDGANLDALAGTCADVGVASLDGLRAFARCLARTHACAVDDVLRDEISDAAGRLGGWPAPGGACPGAP